MSIELAFAFTFARHTYISMYVPESIGPGFARLHIYISEVRGCEFGVSPDPRTGKSISVSVAIALRACERTLVS